MHRITSRGRGRLRARLTYANVVASLALFLALAGGSAYAASKLITGSEIAKGTITSKNIKTKSLLATDFAKNQIPAGKTGATGPAGPAGPQGAQGGQGPAGTAAAYASISINGTGNPVIVPGSSGFTTVSNPSTGIYCLSPAVTSGGNVINPAVTPLAFGGFIAITSNQQCGGGTGAYQIEVVNSNGNYVSLPSGTGFSAIVP